MNIYKFFLTVLLLIFFLFNLLFSVAKNIAGIQMRYQQITDASVESLCTKLSLFTKLKSLDFQCCEIEGDSIAGLANSLSTSYLTSLIFSGNRLSSVAGILLGNALRNSKIQILELADCGLRKRLKLIFRYESRPFTLFFAVTKILQLFCFEILFLLVKFKS